MPTTEIIAVGARNGPFTVKKRVFAQRCDSTLRSDRGLFQSVLDRLVGTMVHLGDYGEDPADPAWFCGHCIEHGVEDNCIGYTPDASVELEEILRTMRDQSPDKHVLFLTDYQFGPEKSKIVTLDSVSLFMKLNRSRRIRFNTLYSIGRKITSSRFWDYYR